MISWTGWTAEGVQHSHDHLRLLDVPHNLLHRHYQISKHPLARCKTIIPRIATISFISIDESVQRAYLGWS
ncbi:hypothetical protein ARMGADRAFT_663390 [Armillaria gallica]|uniref:Uncharacterized protein n=1 Tax=Armillaria gallica TaxID=47427 RepID=A0A2H3DVT9_ARMGA|nr:hypothetical protein ARMGADRAFT_663390 [Armillaria gallica]